MTAPSIDIHAHYRLPHHETPQPTPWTPEDRRLKAERFDAVLRSFPRIVEVSQEAGIDRRILSLPAATILRSEWDTAPYDEKEVQRTNDYLADGVREHSEHLGGLATVDAFAGEQSAAEVRRAVDVLGLSGIVLDSGKGDRFLGVPETLPALQEAALLGVPVFVHPVQTSINPVLVEHAGALGNSFGRGLSNGVALLGLIHRGILENLPNLRIVFTTLGIGALGIAGAWNRRDGLAADDGRWQVYYDTMGLDPQNIAYLVSVLGPDRVVLGTDFPHHVDADTVRLSSALDGAGLSEQDQAKVRSGNALGLLRRRPA